MHVSLFLRIIMAIIFFVSGVAKALDIKGFRSTLTSIRIPPWAAGILPYAVILLELLTAASLLYGAAVRFGAMGLIVLSGGFIWASAVSIRAKLAVSCNCFGEWLPMNLGWTTLLRAVAIGGVGVYLLISRPGPAPVTATLVDILCSALVALGILAVFGLMQVIKGAGTKAGADGRIGRG